MNILLIGNGFDLAHGLPTKYADFIDWIEGYYAFRYFKKNNSNTEYHGTDPQLRFFNNFFYDKSMQHTIDEIYDLTFDNVWIEYFRSYSPYAKENWIDFESEISNIVQSLDNDMDFANRRQQLQSKVFILTNNFLKEKYSQYLSEHYESREKRGFITYKEIRDKLYLDLNKLIRAFEIYLTYYVQKIECTLMSPDIRGIKFDSVLSFNYTNTYARLYDPLKSAKYNYIHGKAESEHTIDTNNMVLGIDEYLPDSKKI